MSINGRDARHTPPIFESVFPLARRLPIQPANQEAGEAERAYARREKLQAHAFALALNIVLVAVIAVQWEEVQAKPIFILSFLLFSVLGNVNASIEGGNPRNINFYVAVQSLLAILMSVSNPVFLVMFLCLLSVQAIMKIGILPGLIWTGAFVCITIAVYWYFSERMSYPFLFNATVACFGFIFFGMFGSALARMRQSREEIRGLLVDLGQANAQLQEYARKVESITTKSERERIARELHDSLGHRLTVSLVLLEGGGRLMKEEPARAADMIKNVRTQLQAGTNELRYTLHRLRTHSISSDNLLDLLQELTDTFAESTDLALHLQLPDALPPPVSDDQCTAVYRIVQEALTNTHKHAEAENVWIALETGDNALNLRIRNDGRDFVLSGKSEAGHGLQGMRERAAQLGGALRVTQPAEGGALVTFSQPLRETASEYA